MQLGMKLFFWSGIFGAALSHSATAAINSCQPFFDHSKDKVISNVAQPGGVLKPGEVDITPEPQMSTAFGERALEICGEFGSKVDSKAVAMLAESFSPDLLKELAREFPGMTDVQLRGAIVKAWVGTNGFEHVFCGQPKIDKVGGLHFAARYYELQQKGELCRLENNLANEEILPDNVFTIGVATSDGVIDRKKGFSIRQTAEDIFFEGARTYLRNCAAPSKQRRVCVSRFYKDDSFGSQFVCAPGKGIITFYSLAVVPKDAVQCK